MLSNTWFESFFPRSDQTEHSDVHFWLDLSTGMETEISITDNKIQEIMFTVDPNNWNLALILDELGDPDSYAARLSGEGSYIIVYLFYELNGVIVKLEIKQFEPGGPDPRRTCVIDLDRATQIQKIYLVQPGSGNIMLFNAIGDVLAKIYQIQEWKKGGNLNLIPCPS